jgi:plastocyanin
VALGLLFILGPAIAWGQTVHEVQMTYGLTFDRAQITIAVGDTLCWINVAKLLLHTATADGHEVRRAGFNQRWPGPHIVLHGLCCGGEGDPPVESGRAK